MSETICTITNTLCRHCSTAIYLHIKREGNVAEKNFKKKIEKIELGLFCNNVSDWIDRMKSCPIDTCTKLQDIPKEQLDFQHKTLLKFWRKHGIDVSNL